MRSLYTVLKAGEESAVSGGPEEGSVPQAHDQRGVSVGTPGGKDQRAETGGREVGAGEAHADSGSMAAEHHAAKAATVSQAATVPQAATVWHTLCCGFARIS